MQSIGANLGVHIFLYVVQPSGLLYQAFAGTVRVLTCVMPGCSLGRESIGGSQRFCFVCVCVFVCAHMG